MLRAFEEDYPEAGLPLLSLCEKPLLIGGTTPDRWHSLPAPRELVARAQTLIPSGVALR